VWWLYDKQNFTTKGIEKRSSSNDLLDTTNKKIIVEEIPNQILATGKDVIVIGGGDTF
jgi:glutamate synthase (NADPH/NADH) small chain